MSALPEPVKLPANQPPQFYRGGTAIAALRGSTSALAYGPEDWVGSTTARFGHADQGLSRLPDGRVLRDVIDTAPIEWLGAEHVARFGTSTALLVKLLDADQRLPVHFHPSNGFARTHFHAPCGKAEAWIVIGTRGEDPHVYMGFRAAQSEEQIRTWVEHQDHSSVLSALHRTPVRPGDSFYIPPGLPHAIGGGVFIVEVQQPSDFSLNLEWQGFLDSPNKAHLGLGFDTALAALDRSAWDLDRLATLHAYAPDDSRVDSASGVVDLLAPAAASYFRADRIQPPMSGPLSPSFAVLVVLAGSGTLRTEHGRYSLHHGETFVVPFAAGESFIDGDVTAIRCRPPAPEQ